MAVVRDVIDLSNLQGGIDSKDVGVDKPVKNLEEFG